MLTEGKLRSAAAMRLRIVTSERNRGIRANLTMTRSEAFTNMREVMRGVNT
jgi:hypothetical protein